MSKKTIRGKEGQPIGGKHVIRLSEGYWTSPDPAPRHDHADHCDKLARGVAAVHAVLASLPCGYRKLVLKAALDLVEPY